ncbi:Transferase [Trema orientale]|uniref:Transferase n=1 Tax=Trema orientale TaxID=63057 RepID=A0A2P5FZ13_TREOI|nr:Transferase [Trema orientale]
MIINVRETTMIRPAEETPRDALWLSNMDLMTAEVHVPTVYFYRHSEADNFFDAAILKDALGKVLVPFYPLAGRLRIDNTGRLEVDCNAEGVLFVEAETSSVLDELGDFTPTMELRKLVPPVDRSRGVSSFSLLVLQICYFKCGAVSLGVGVEHRLVDGTSGMHFVKEWSNIARGLRLSLQPLLDRTFLRARDPPQPKYPHVEYQPCPKLMKTLEDNERSGSRNDDDITVVGLFEIKEAQIRILKAKSKDGGNTINHSTYEILAGHVWKCASKARSLSDEQETKLFIPTSGRSRFLQPPFQPNFFGNVVFTACAIATVGDLKSKPSWYAARKIHDAITQMTDDYLRSSIDFVELLPNISSRGLRSDVYGNPNLGINSWVRLPVYDADFGWGRPFNVGPAGIAYDGKSFLLPTLADHGSVALAIALRSQHMKVFKKLLYDDI